MSDHLFPECGIWYRTNVFSADRETLVFIHGLSGSLSAWELYEERFKDSYNILTYDIRGHGKSRKPKTYTDYAIKEFSRDLEALLSHLGIEGCVLISHSFGTLIAFQFLHDHPDPVTRAVFLSPSVAPYTSALARLTYPFTYMASLAVRPLPFSGRIGWHVDYAKFPNTTDWDIPIMWANIRSTTLRVYLFCTLQSYAFDAGPWLDQISIPVLLMHGKRDTIFPVENSFIIRTHIQGSLLIVLPDIDHILVLNRFPEVSLAISDFVKQDPFKRLKFNAAGRVVRP